MLGIVVAAGERLHRGECGQGHRVDRGFGAAAHDHVGLAGTDQVQAQVQGFGAGGAGGDGRVRAGPGAQVKAHRGGHAVGHEHRDGHGQDPAGALLLQRVPRVEQGPHAADAGGEGNGQAVVVDFGDAGISPGLAGGNDAELRGRVHALGLDAAQDLKGGGGAAGGEVDRQFVLGYPVVFERVCAGDPLQRVLPHSGYIAADGRGGTQTGNDYFACHGITLCRCAVPCPVLLGRGPESGACGGVCEKNSVVVLRLAGPETCRPGRPAGFSRRAAGAYQARPVRRR